MPRLRVNYKFTVLHTVSATANADSADSADSGVNDDVALLADADADVQPPSLSGDNDIVGVDDERDQVRTFQ